MNNPLTFYKWQSASSAEINIEKGFSDMDIFYLYIAGVVCVLVLVVFTLWNWNLTRKGRALAKDSMIQVLPIWAELGSFESGSASSLAMKAAFTVVEGAEAAQDRQYMFDAHAIAFDENLLTFDQI